MPELPEVQTTINGLRRKILNKKILSVWSDWQKVAKSPLPFSAFQKLVVGKKIEEIERHGKNIVFYLSGGIVMVAHQKMTGHFMVGKFVLQDGKMLAQDKKISKDPYNKYIHLLFKLSGGGDLALSDVRKFAHVFAGRDAQDIFKKSGVDKLGPDALKVSANDFDKSIQKQKRPIKAVLMDQELISGIGNIYGDEILWEAKINPFSRSNNLSATQIKNIFKATHKILPYATKLGGTSTSDYRDTAGKKGNTDCILKRIGKQTKNVQGKTGVLFKGRF
ncbi:MAG: DNA-formamidopyrimidine glycosylase family protein [Patescibacteria group bacterium]